MEITSAHRHHQIMAAHPEMEEALNCPKAHHHHQPPPQFHLHQQQLQQQQERKPRPHPDQALKCPRCDSTNTKFCYYNNYSLSQPRYFCKGCRRYWTQGGSLRNVPVGGGCRRNKRPPSSPASSGATAGGCAGSPCKKAQDAGAAAVGTSPLSTPFLPSSSLLPSTALLPPPAALGYDPSDLTLAFAGLQKPVVPDGKAGVLDIDADQDMLFLGSAGHGFLDILKARVPGATTATPAFHCAYYGYGPVADVVPFDAGAATDGKVEVGSAGEQDLQLAVNGDGGHGNGNSDNGNGDKLVMGLQWQQLAGAAGDAGGIVMDVGREYWSNSVGSWHGIINSSLM